MRNIFLKPRSISLSAHCRFRNAASFRAGLLFIACWFSFVAEATSQEETATPVSEKEAVVEKIVRTANEFVETCNENEQKQLLFEFSNLQQRIQWSNLPTGIFERNGLRWGDLSTSQKEALKKLMRATLSENGFQQVIENMAGDEYLTRDGGGRGRVKFGEAEYYVSILGKPSSTQPWMWQFGGHHLAINATIVGNDVTLSPSLTGGQPMDFDSDGKPIHQMSQEIELAFKLINNLPPAQQKIAITSQNPTDLKFGPTSKTNVPTQDGIQLEKMSEQHQSLAKQLIWQRVNLVNKAQAKPLMDRINREFDKTYFSWGGSTKKGEAASYRIQGPSLLMEFCPQGRRRADQHIHAMFRVPGNDYGAALLKARSAKLKKTSKD